MTQTTKHTPGPWYVAYGSIYTDPTGDAMCIGHADRNEPETSPTERDANVALMAAAPGLAAKLERSEQMVKELEDMLRGLFKVAANYAPKSIRDSRRFTVEQARALLSRLEQERKETM